MGPTGESQVGPEDATMPGQGRSHTASGTGYPCQGQWAEVPLTSFLWVPGSSELSIPEKQEGGTQALSTVVMVS